MKVNKRVLAASIIAAIGVVAAVNSASAAVVADGTYNLTINVTPTATTGYGATQYKFGSDGNWKSSFTFGGGAPSTSSQAMTDNGATVASLGGAKGSGINGDGFAGILGITVTGGTFTVNGVAGMGGTINQTTGAMTLDPTGRLGAVSGFPSLYDERWNVNNCTFTTSGTCSNNGNTAYQQFSTVSATAVGQDTNGNPFSTTIHGKALTSTGAGTFNAILVTGGQVGSDWGGFFGAGYFEAWNINLTATATAHSGFNVDTIFGTAGGNFAQYTAAAPVPVPAAVWLFGSGLLGLVGVARRKKA